MTTSKIVAASLFACLIGGLAAPPSFAEQPANSPDTGQPVGTWIGVPAGTSGKDQSIWIINSRTGAVMWCLVTLGGPNQVSCASQK
jgi:hypothetical protein